MEQVLYKAEDDNSIYGLNLCDFQFLHKFWEIEFMSLRLEMGGIPTLSAVTKSTTALSDALWEPHISMLSRFI